MHAFQHGGRAVLTSLPSAGRPPTQRRPCGARHGAQRPRGVGDQVANLEPGHAVDCLKQCPRAFMPSRDGSFADRGRAMIGVDEVDPMACWRTSTWPGPATRRGCRRPRGPQALRSLSVRPSFIKPPGAVGRRPRSAAGRRLASPHHSRSPPLRAKSVVAAGIGVDFDLRMVLQGGQDKRLGLLRHELVFLSDVHQQRVRLLRSPVEFFSCRRHDRRPLASPVGAGAKIKEGEKPLGRTRRLQPCRSSPMAPDLVRWSRRCP